MNRLREALAECVQTTQWINRPQRIGPSDLKRLYLRGGGGENTLRLAGLFRPEPSQTSVDRLAIQLRTLFDPFVSADTDRIGNGLFALLGGHSKMREPTMPEFAQNLIKPATILGTDRVVDLLCGWANGKPLRYQECVLLEGVTIEKDLQLQEGIRLQGLPRSTADLPLSLPYYSRMSRNEYLGGVVLRIDCEMSPAVYAPSNTENVGLSDEPQGSITCASGEIPKLGQDAFCESLSLACNHYIGWRSSWSDHGDLQLFMGMGGGVSYKPQTWPAKVRMSQDDLDSARTIHLARYSSNRKRSLDIATRRWMTSKQRPSFADKLIELRIALEALYLKGGFGELKFRMATCCAWHLGADYDSRQKIFETVGKLYAIASKAVHGHTIEPKEESGAVLASAQDICRQGILKRLNEAGEPDWDKYVLGGCLAEDEQPNVTQ